MNVQKITCVAPMQRSAVRDRRKAVRLARTIKVCVKVKTIAAIMATPNEVQPAYIFCVVMYSAVDRDILLCASRYQAKCNADDRQ